MDSSGAPWQCRTDCCGLPHPEESRDTRRARPMQRQRPRFDASPLFASRASSRTKALPRRMPSREGATTTRVRLTCRPPGEFLARDLRHVKPNAFSTLCTRSPIRLENSNTVQEAVGGSIEGHPNVRQLHGGGLRLQPGCSGRRHHLRVGPDHDGRDFTAVGGDDMAAQMREAYAGLARVLAMFGAGPATSSTRPCS